MKINKKLQTLLFATTVWVIIVGIWELLGRAGLLNTAFIAIPSGILSELGNEDLLGFVLIDAFYSISRMIVGLVFAYLLVLILTYLVILSPYTSTIISQVRSLLKFVPPPVLIPLSILAVGINNGTVIAVVFITGTFLILDYSFSILAKEYNNYADLFDSWRTKVNSKYFNFFLPMSHYLSYRFISNLIIWALSVTIFSEIVTGVSQGFGPRLIQLQQLYQSNLLFALIGSIILFAFVFERLLVFSLSRYKFDILRTVSSIVVVVFIISSTIFQFSLQLESLENSDKIVISTYPGTINLPLMVYQSKFDTIGTTLQTTSSGAQTMDNLLAGKAAIAGYADIPNVLSGINQNRDLKIVSQSEETLENPILFMISPEDISPNDYSNLSASKVGYYPNNSVVRAGVEVTLALGGARISGNEYVSSNDAGTLSQSLVSNQLDVLVTIEPFVTQIEKQTELKRINTNETLIRGVSFEKLPLTGVVIDTDQLSEEQISDFVQGIEQSIEYIRSNTDNNFANEELRNIMEANDIDPDSQIPYFSFGDELDPQNMNLIVDLTTQYDQEIGEKLEELDINTLYL